MAQGAVVTAGVREHVLKNGLRVLMKEVRTTPVVSMMTCYRVGSAQERSGETGISHFLEHMMFKGTDRYGKGEIDLITQRNGGSNNAFTTYDYTAYHFTFASDRWHEGLAIEASRMRCCAFDPVEFAAEKQVVLEEWRMCQDSPWHPLIDQISAAAFADHPYRHPILGWYHEVQDLTRERMVAYYDRFYGPNNATLVLVGDFDTDEALQQVEATFGGLEPIAVQAPAPVRELPNDTEKRLTLRRPSAVPRLVLAFRQPPFGHPDVPAVEVLTTLLSHGRTSRLFQALVEDQQLVGDIGMEFFLTVDPFLMMIFTEIKPGVAVAKVERAILAEIRRLQKELVDEAELTKAKNLLVAGQAFDDETSMHQAQRYAEAAMLGDWRDADQQLERYLAVTAADIRRVAKRYLDPASRLVGVQKNGKRQPLFDDAEAGEPVEAPPPQTRQPVQPVLAAPRLSLPEVKRWELPNGMVLIVQANDASPTVAMKTYVMAGSRCEPADQAGLASLLSHAMIKGAGSRDAQAFAETIEMVGGSLDAGAGVSGTSLSARFLKAQTTLGLDLLADVLQRPRLEAEEVAKERDLLIDDLLASEDDPRTLARRAFHKQIFGDHPAGRPTDGFKETVTNLQPDTLRAFHRQWFAPDRTTLVVVGDVDPQAIYEQVVERFAAWPKVTPGQLWLPPPPAPAASRQIVRQDWAQANIFLGQVGIRRRDADYVPLEVLETILGGGSGLNSRIPMRIRDELGLAYTACCDLVGTAGHEPGVFYAYMATDPANAAAAIAELRAECERICREPVSRLELEDAQAYLTGSFVFNVESNAQKADYLLRAELFQLGFDWATTYTDAVLRVTIDDLQRVARQHLQPEAMALAVIGPVDEANIG
jgi:zinc protease